MRIVIVLLQALWSDEGVDDNNKRIDDNQEGIDDDKLPFRMVVLLPVIYLKYFTLFPTTRGNPFIMRDIIL